MAINHRKGLSSWRLSFDIKILETKIIIAQSKVAHCFFQRTKNNGRAVTKKKINFNFIRTKILLSSRFKCILLKKAKVEKVFMEKFIMTNVNINICTNDFFWQTEAGRVIEYNSILWFYYFFQIFPICFYNVSFIQNKFVECRLVQTSKH